MLNAEYLPCVPPLMDKLPQGITQERVEFTFALLRSDREMMTDFLMERWGMSRTDALRIFRRDETEIMADYTRLTAGGMRKAVQHHTALYIGLN